ncbi:MAG: hypothetical protein F6K08_23235 [Okeania sp. SIO1H6]|nr:hypothetical protein [Okeania sp. SIO1H6]
MINGSKIATDRLCKGKKENHADINLESIASNISSRKGGDRSFFDFFIQTFPRRNF